MTPVGAYLKKLLYQYDCVVVPELGGFLTHYQPASYVAETGQFLPPRKRLAFNEALRLDDGILFNYIMLHESLSRDETARFISDFVTDLKQHVQLAGSYSVEGIGLFTPNAEGRLQFDPELRHNFFGESFGMTALNVEKVTAIPVESVEAEEVTPIYALGPVRRDEILHETPFVAVSRPRPLLRWAAAAAIVGTLGAISYLTVVEPGQPMESSLNPANWFQMPTWLESSFRTETKPARELAIAKPAKRPVAIAVPAPVAPEGVPTTVEPTPAAPVALPANAPTATPVPVATPAAKPIIVPARTVVNRIKPVAAKPLAEKAAVANPFVTEPVAEGTVEAAAPKVVAKTTGPLFTVVAGSFASKPNAVRFRKTLMNAGYSDAFIMAPTRKGGLYKVAAIGSPDREFAIAKTDSLLKLTGIQPFVIKN
ncbi:MAG: SPOR domain-containing protein [Cytophagales bacterium]|nr:MAG: SPOR domain-containing protein [Cytophagales bacterium]